jgi:hypothetical protein
MPLIVSLRFMRDRQASSRILSTFLEYMPLSHYPRLWEKCCHRTLLYLKYALHQKWIRNPNLIAYTCFASSKNMFLNNFELAEIAHCTTVDDSSFKKATSAGVMTIICSRCFSPTSSMTLYRSKQKCWKKIYTYSLNGLLDTGMPHWWISKNPILQIPVKWPLIICAKNHGRWDHR